MCEKRCCSRSDLSRRKWIDRQLGSCINDRVCAVLISPIAVNTCLIKIYSPMAPVSDLVGFFLPNSWRVSDFLHCVTTANVFSSCRLPQNVNIVTLVIYLCRLRWTSETNLMSCSLVLDEPRGLWLTAKFWSHVTELFVVNCLVELGRQFLNFSDDWLCGIHTFDRRLIGSCVWSVFNEIREVFDWRRARVVS
jgi:hypothetical protein